MTVPARGGQLWIRRFHPAPDAGVRLVALPHAGGSASFYFPLSRALAPRVEVLSVQYPGRQDRLAERCIDDIGELADRLAAELRPWADRPLALFGHSMGAAVGFEVARRMEVAPIRLIASGRRAPSTHRDEWVHLSDDDGLVADLRKLSGTAAGVLGDDELLRMILPAVRSDYRAAETYQGEAGAKVACPITVLLGDDDPKVTLAEAEAWREHTDAEVDLRVFPGGHFYLVEHQAEVLAVLDQRLKVPDSV
ncbi:thioesterase II family protein [Saccharopolyspora elongata]|uniref:Thioesterase n=1 Tax=Saccharopolyspora elongata TaxID=2530387 RepID=A0A4R4YVE8_9PSEU|nr:alpha/beta fold hydrolase [Saccharopolyspora elongata]TDD48810.1 thioesterase [Saccharopolyspora elongata]